MEPGPIEELLPIGRFSRLTGLSIGALRHYDAEGLLAPARVDASTSYRYYRRDQADDARLIGRLRELGLGLSEVRVIVAADQVQRRRLLEDHRARVSADLSRMQRAIHHLNRTIDHGEPIMTASAAAPQLTTEEHRRLGVDLFNHVWSLIEEPDRSVEQVDDLIHAAHASRYHWSRVQDAGPEHAARGEWQCSRVYAVLGRADPSLWHARRCLAICEANGIGDWDLAFAYEAMARAHGVAGDRIEAARYLTMARSAAEGISDPEDRELLEGDLATLP